MKKRERNATEGKKSEIFSYMFFYSIISLSTIACFLSNQTETLEGEKESYLGKIDVKEEGLFGVGDLDAVLLVKWIGDVEVVHCLRDSLHSLSVSGFV